MSARILCTVECKLIQVGFHRPFATKTTADDVCSKQKGTNEWYIIASPPKVSCSHQQDLTQIYSFIISIIVEIVDHQMTYVTTNHSRQEHTFTFHNPADLLFSNLIGSTLHMNNKTNEQMNLIGSTLHMNNKTNEQSTFKIMSISGAKYINSCWKVRVNLNWSNGTSFFAFLLVQKAHVTTGVT